MESGASHLPECVMYKDLPDMYHEGTNGDGQDPASAELLQAIRRRDFAHLHHAKKGDFARAQ